jgi:hypothetical protein
VSGDLQQERRGNQKLEHEQEIEPEGPALPARVLSIADPPPPPEIELPAPGAEAGGNELLATIEPASLDAPVTTAPDVGEPGGGGGGVDKAGGGASGGSGGGGEGATSGPSGA